MYVQRASLQLRCASTLKIDAKHTYISMINQFECHDNRVYDKMRFQHDSMRKKGKQARREKREKPVTHFWNPEKKKDELENEANHYARARVDDPLRRSPLAIHALHDEIEIANNAAMEQYAPLTLICIKGVRIVSISNAVYTWLTVS